MDTENFICSRGGKVEVTLSENWERIEHVFCPHHDWIDTRKCNIWNKKRVCALLYELGSEKLGGHTVTQPLMAKGQLLEILKSGQFDFLLTFPDRFLKFEPKPWVKSDWRWDEEWLRRWFFGIWLSEDEIELLRQWVEEQNEK